MLKLKSHKAKIVRLNNTYRQRVILKTAEQDRVEGESPSLHHLIKHRKRQENQMINKIRDDNGAMQETSTAIVEAFTTHFQKAFQPINVKEKSMGKVLQRGIRSLSPEMSSLTGPITEDELWKAVSKGKSYKATGVDGIGLEFYRSKLDVIKTEFAQIISCMFLNDPLIAQVNGHVCTPKKPHPVRIKDYRPLTLLKADYKILARIIGNRLKPILQDLIHPRQHCGIQGTSVFEAVAKIRDIITHVEKTESTMCKLP
jgi:hypothetical protein